MTTVRILRIQQWPKLIVSARSSPGNTKRADSGASNARGKRYYLGRTKPEAFRRYQQFSQRIERGLRIPDLDDTSSDDDDLLTVEDICNRFLEVQESRVKSQELSQRSFRDYLSTCRDFCESVGKLLIADDLTPEYFSNYRADVSNRRNIIGVGNEVTRVKTVFKWAFESDLLEKAMKFGPDFKRPKKRDIRIHRAAAGPKVFERDEILFLLDELGIHWRAMAFLGINAGFGNTDCSELKLTDIDLDSATVQAIRTKTGEARFATLWPETVTALRLSLSRRQKPTSKEATTRFFLDYDGSVLIDQANIGDVVGKRITGALQRLKLHTPGKSFYWLRHTFRTVADKTGDETAIRWIMGHTDDRIDRTYIHNAPVERIRAVTDYVRSWLLGVAK